MTRGLQLRLSFLHLMLYFTWGTWFVTAGTYCMKTLGFSGIQVGMIYSTTAIAATVSPLITGIIADKYLSIEKLLSISHFCGAILLFSISKVSTFTHFYILILLYTLIFLPGFSLTNALSFYHLKDVKKDFPKIRVWGTIAWIIAGVMVSALNIEDSSTQFVIAASFSAILTFYSLTLPHTPPVIEKGESIFQILQQDDMKLIMGKSGFLIIFICVGLICIPSAYYYSFVNPFLNEMGVENAAGKMALGQITEIFTILLLPFFFRIWKLRFIIFVGLFTWGFRYLLLIVGIKTGLEVFYIISLSLHGIAYVFALLATQIAIDIKVPNKLRSTAQGFFSFLTLGLAAFIGTLTAGKTVSYFSLETGHDWSTIWLIPGLFGLLVAFGFIIFFRADFNLQEKSEI